MAERRHRSSDVANFDTYPADPPEAGDLYVQDETPLEQQARQVGSAMGRAVAGMRKAQGKVRNIASDSTETATTLKETAKSKARLAVTGISDLAGTARSKAQEWGEAALTQAGQLRHATQQKAAEMRPQVRRGYADARARASQVAGEYPLQIVLAAGIAGFLLGMGLRIWRASREY